jgi:phosphosulfolactate synthase (CoM biosynthesis protein A)
MDHMDLPLKFPDPQEEARKRAEEFQRLSSTDRWREMAAMMAFGWEMVRTSPRRAEIERRMRDQEDEWRRIQQEIFVRYGG